MPTSELALIDPAESKAFDLRRFSLNLRDRIGYMEDVDELQQLDSLMVGVKHRLVQLKEDAVEAERTRVLIVKRIGELVGPAKSGPTEESGPWPIKGAARNRVYYARLLAERPEIVAEQLRQPKVTLNKTISAVQRVIREERAEANMQKLNAKMDEGPEVQRGQWWALGPHRLYCGDSTDPKFIEAVRQVDPVFAFADPPYNPNRADLAGGFDWQHDWLAEVAPVVAVTPGVAAMGTFLQLTSMNYRWTVACELAKSRIPSPLGFAAWVPILLFASNATSLGHEANDHIRVESEPLHEFSPARKPVRGLVLLLEIFTSTGDSIVDPFLGSGTTLIAADRRERRCIGAEIDPVACGGIIARYGKKAEPL